MTWFCPAAPPGTEPLCTTGLRPNQTETSRKSGDQGFPPQLSFVLGNSFTLADHGTRPCMRSESAGSRCETSPAPRRGSAGGTRHVPAGHRRRGESRAEIPWWESLQGGRRGAGVPDPGGASGNEPEGWARGSPSAAALLRIAGRTSGKQPASVFLALFSGLVTLPGGAASAGVPCGSEQASCPWGRRAGMGTDCVAGDLPEGCI